MKNNSEDKNFDQILRESDKRHADALRRRNAKKRELFSLLGGKKPGTKDSK